MKFLVIPRIVPFSFEEPIFAGFTTQVTCLVSEGDAPIDITWSLHGSESLTDLGISTSKIGSKVSVLIIETTALHHRGNYTCTARNQAGSANYTATLNINGNIQNECKNFAAKYIRGLLICGLVSSLFLNQHRTSSFWCTSILLYCKIFPHLILPQSPNCKSTLPKFFKYSMFNKIRLQFNANDSK